MKKISGSWFEFQHCGWWEARDWNPRFLYFKPKHWEALLEEMAEIGLEYLVLMHSALNSKTFYRSVHFESFPMATDEPMEVMFQAADRLGMKIFVGNDFFGEWRYADRMFFDREVARRREIAMEEIAERFAHHPSFYGWYWPNELDIYPYYDDVFLRYVKENNALNAKFTPGKKTLIAPYGTFHLKVDEHFLRNLEELDVDVVAYQDEIGVKKANVEWTPLYFERLKAAHDKVGRSALWADMEIFEFEGTVYRSALYGADFSRVRRQLEGIAPFVEKVLIYQYPGLMSKPGSKAFTPNSVAEKLYDEYVKYLQGI